MIFVRENGTAPGAHCECWGGGQHIVTPACRPCVSIRITFGGGICGECGSRFAQGLSGEAFSMASLCLTGGLTDGMEISTKK